MVYQPHACGLGTSIAQAMTVAQSRLVNLPAVQEVEHVQAQLLAVRQELAQEREAKQVQQRHDAAS